MSFRASDWLLQNSANWALSLIRRLFNSSSNFVNFSSQLNGKFREAILWIDGFPVVDTNLGSEGIFSSKVKTLYRIRLEFVKVCQMRVISQ